MRTGTRNKIIYGILAGAVAAAGLSSCMGMDMSVGVSSGSGPVVGVGYTPPYYSPTLGYVPLPQPVSPWIGGYVPPAPPPRPGFNGGFNPGFTPSRPPMQAPGPVVSPRPGTVIRPGVIVPSAPPGAIARN